MVTTKKEVVAAEPHQVPDNPFVSQTYIVKDHEGVKVRLAALEKFMDTEEFSLLDTPTKTLLQRERGLLIEYVSVLGQRVPS